MNINVVFGRILADYRRKKSLSQEALAEKSDLHRTYVSQLERGIRQPSLKVILKLAAALGVPAGKIVTEVEKKVGKN